MWQTGDQYSQWALNPSAYQNVAHDKVDWAALAQQWIQMKDTHPDDQVPPAPPPPSLGRPEDRKDLEGGEAPMEMDKDELESADSLQEAPAWGAWNNWQQWGNWGWGGTGGVDPAAGVPPPTPAAIIAKQGGMVGSALPVPGYGYPPGAAGYAGQPAGNFDYNQAPVAEPYNQVMVGGYWTAGPSGDATSNMSGQGHGPAPFIRSSRQDWRRSSRGHDRTRSADKSDDEEDSTVALDAAKRRQLPAWIREGLEKMEREKQKKIDRDRQMKEREIYLQKKREDEEDALNQMQQNNTGQPMVPKKSKFESDSEESDHGDNRVTSPVSTSRRKSRFRNADSPTSSPLGVHVRDPTPEPEPVRTQEEILHERMLKVRRMLTEILLEVTTEEMESVAQEVLTKAKAKAPALQLRKTPALASLTGKLGLGMYGDSDESESEDSSDDRVSHTNGADSDEELKDQIQRRKQEFIKTEREIEARLMEEDERERERERRLTAEASDEDTVEERQVEKQSDSKRPNAQDGIKFKEEHDKTPRSATQSELGKHEENSHRSNNDRLSPPPIKKEKSEDTIDHSYDKVKHEKSASSDDNVETSSKSDSDDSSTSKSASSSSVESKHSLKKSSKNNRLKSHEKKGSKKRSDSSERKHKKSDKKSSRSKDRKRERESKDLKVKDKKKEKHRKSRSRSRSGRSLSKEIRKAKRSRSGESRRSKRSRSHESHRSKTNRQDSQSVTSRGSEHRRYSDGKHSLHKSHNSRSKDKNHKSHSDEKSSYKYRDSYSPVKEKKSSSSKRRRDSSLSRSPSLSKSRRYLDKKESVGHYSRSRSISPPSRTLQKSRRHRSTSSSDGSAFGAKGKTAGR